MHQITEKLFISDVNTLTSISSSALLLQNKITDIISIGCRCPSEVGNAFRSISFPNIEDSPETALLHVFLDVCTFFPPESLLIGERKIVIHCVYGQSRSASIIVLYLMEIGNTLQESIRILSRAKPTICINPGTKFIDQYFFRIFFITYYYLLYLQDFYLSCIFLKISHHTVLNLS